MKFNTPTYTGCYHMVDRGDTVSKMSRIIIVKDTTTDYYSVKATTNIGKDEIILVEYPKCTLYGDLDIDRGLQVIRKYIEHMDTNYIKELYPRDFTSFKPNQLIKNIHKIIKCLDTDKKHNTSIHTHTLVDFFKQYSKKIIEFYYAKYIFNAFEGFQYGPLTLPILAKFNHSCQNSNIKFNFDVHKGCMIVKATLNIKKGDELFNSYLYNKHFTDHKKYILDHYNFNCDCNT